jgi:hypothetical protein
MRHGCCSHNVPARKTVSESSIFDVASFTRVMSFKVMMLLLGAVGLVGVDISMQRDLNQTPTNPEGDCVDVDLGSRPTPGCGCLVEPLSVGLCLTYFCELHLKHCSDVIWYFR